MFNSIRDAGNAIMLYIWSKGISLTSTKQSERGQGLVEYALILVLVSVVVIVILALLGPAIRERLGVVWCSLVSSNNLKACNLPGIE